MRFMMFMLPKDYANAKPDAVPSLEMVQKMMKFNDELAKSGALIALDGLHPPASGTRVSYSAGKPKVTDGPFTEAKEMVGGYWMIQCKSKEEAVEWARRVPGNDGDIVEVRQVFEMSEFPADVQKAADNLSVQKTIKNNLR